MAYGTHTPGPWFIGTEHDSLTAPDTFVENDTDGWPYFVHRARGAAGDSGYHPALGIQDLDDARLIAAAPDLLAALKEMMRRFEPDQAEYDDGSGTNPPDWLVLARAAIAKAEGRAP